MKKLAVLGASGHGRVLADAASLLGWDEIYFFDDAWPTLIVNSHWEVIGDTVTLLGSLSNFDGVIVAVGNNEVRLNKFLELNKSGANLITLIHPNAVVSQFTSIGLGSFIGAGAILQVDCRIGTACIINSNSVIEHDCDISNGAHISPSAALAGGVFIGEKSWVGIGSSVKQSINIGTDVVIGAGSVVIRDVPDDIIVAGNPAKPLHEK